MTKAERIVLAIIKAETAAMGYCAYEGLAARLANYLDHDEAESFMAAAEVDDLVSAFCSSIPLFAGVYLGIYGFRYGERATEPGIRV